MISKKLLKDYAELLAEKGLNVQKGQFVVINCDIEQPEFVQLVAEAIYKRGARKVIINFTCQKLQALKYKKTSLKALCEFEDFEVARLKWAAEKLPATLYLVSDDPFGFNGVKDEKLTKPRAAKYPIVKPFSDAMDGRYQWCIAAVPGKAWAKRLFPSLSSKKAVEELWKNILAAALVDGNARKNWDDHNANVHSKCEYLNSLGLKKLYYKSSDGTDFEVELNERGIFLGGSEKTRSGVTYNPNIPSYEVFTSPVAGRCNGTVVATKPLSYGGKLIENFSITFKDGAVSSVKAEKGEELLKQIVSLDKGAGKLGEVALVPFDNPINYSGVLFYETLFDENACCHLALGRGFMETIKGYENMDMDQAMEAGLNESMIHVDFMIGSRDLEIVGETADGRKEIIFANGNWAK